MRHFFLIVWAATILAVLSVNTPSQTPNDEGGSGNSKGSITGRVVDQNGQPLRNATVSVRPYANGSRGETSMSDAEGNFKVEGLDPYAYIVSATLPAYIATPRDPDATPIGFYRVGDTANIELMKGGVITGNVKRANSDPMVAVVVRAYMIRDSKGQPPRYGVPMRSRTTDDRGVYRIYGLPPGTYIVAAGGDTGYGNPYVVDPFAGEVPTYAPSSPRATATEVTLGPGEEAANVDIRYREEEGHTISGTATAAIATDVQNGFSLTLTPVTSGAQVGYTNYQQPGGRGFAFSGVPDGEYDLIAQQYTGTGWVVSDPRRIQVRGADVAGVELVARPLASIGGNLVLEDSKLPECQNKRRPIFGETVIGPYHDEKTVPKDQPSFLYAIGSPTVPDKDGKFWLRNLAEGKYRFNVRPMAKYWCLKSISWPTGAAAPLSKTAAPPDRPKDAARYWTNVHKGEQLTGLTITFAGGAASLRGQIDIGEGKKLSARMFVYLTPAEPDQAEDILRYFVVLTGEDGSFSLTNLPPGRYWVVAATAAKSDSNVMSRLRLPDETDLRASLLRDGVAARNQTELKPCQNVSDYHLPLNSPVQ